MPDYSDGRNILSRPEPGRILQKNVKEVVRERPVDTNAIVEAVIKGITDKMPKFIVGNNGQGIVSDDFDNSVSLAKLAEAMTNTKESEGKIEGIGIIRETKKDEKETKNTIDMLSKLGD